jgi:glutathione peroxidase
MTLRQRLLELIYPLLIRIPRTHTVVYKNEKHTRSLENFYALKVEVNNTELSFESMKGRTIVLVNTASDCGYTAQYKELQLLQDMYKNELTIIAFPNNDFKNQEKLNDDQISRFCNKYFDVSFPIVKKTTVTKSDHQHPVFKWLSDPLKNGWNSQEPGWNFYKYIIYKEGTLTHVFGSGISPLSKQFLNAIKEL